ncbi:MAG: hypothetical protein VKN72_04755 [Nostocales cyanobacterium 94392]|nr:hypothetical protein [Nostocales cyanobacterium 94392]
MSSGLLCYVILMNPKDEEMLARDGVDKISKSYTGRKYLANLQKKYENDILQPNNPKFNKVYGKRIEEQKKLKEKNETIANDMWLEAKEKRGENMVTSFVSNYQPLVGCPKCHSRKFKRTEENLKSGTYKTYIRENCKECGYWHISLTP